MNNLELIIKELDNYKRNKEQLMYKYINDRLTKSLNSYYKELRDSVNFLNSKEELKIIKKINNL